MLKALIRKQFLELGSVFLRNRKTGKISFGKSSAGFIVLYAFCILSVGVAFFGMGQLFSDTLLPAGLDWFYFAMMGMIGIFLSVLLNSLSTFTMMYLSKDNELLLSMPIKPSAILISRMILVYTLGFIFEAVVIVPAVIVYWTKTDLTAAKVILPILLLFVVGFFVLVFTSLIGWLIAMISSKLRNKNIITTLISVVFILGFYYLQLKTNSLLQQFVQNADRIGKFVDRYLLLFRWLGEALSGSIPAFLFFTGVTALLTVLLLVILSKTFIGITTANKGAKKTVYNKKLLKQSGTSKALLMKELKHFVSSPVYMLNTGLGTVFLLLGGVIALIKKDVITQSLTVLTENSPFPPAVLPVLIACAICLLSSMDAVSAPSVSLEGKNLWLLQSLPIEPAEVLRSKIRLHVLLDSVPAVIAEIMLGIALGADIPSVIAGIVFILAFIWFDANVGLIANLKKPMLEWTNESLPVKQSSAVLISMLTGVLILLVAGGLSFVLSAFAAPWICLAVFSVILFIADFFTRKWLMTEGAVMFAEL